MSNVSFFSQLNEQFTLVLGDLHVPYRTTDIPPALKALLEPGILKSIICTGNLCSKEVLSYLKSLAPEIKLAKGEFDKGIDKEFDTFTLGKLKFGLIHGHQITPWNDKESLLAWQRKLDVDVLITGNSHELSFYEYQGKLFFNPGSATGAFHPLKKTIPSFFLMDVQGTQIIIYVYSLVDGKLEVEKKNFTVKK